MTLEGRAAEIVCTLVAAVVYLNSLDCGFCFDDSSAVRDNMDLRPVTPWTNLIWDDFWGTPMHVEGSHKSYRPLVVASFRLNYLFHELEPMGYHLVNVLLHAIVSYLYVRLCLVVFGETWPALVAGLLFAVHPIHTEAVAGVVGRAETLSAMFFLLCIFMYREAVLERKTSKLLLMLVFCLCSVLSKEQGITVVAVCLFVDVFVFLNLDCRSAVVALQMWAKGGKAPVWFGPLSVRTLVLGVFAAATMFLRVTIMKAELPVFTVHDNPAVSFPTPYRQLHWLHLCFVNCWLLLSPLPLCADWTMGTIPPITSLTDPSNVATVITFTVMATLGVYATGGTEKRRKVVAVALSLAIFPFIPASNLLFPVGFVVAERILYVPSMGFCMLVGLGISILGTPKLGWWRLLVKPLLVLLLLAHGLKTVSRNRDWFSDTTLFTSAIRVNPLNGKIHNNLGHEYERTGDLARAESLFRRAADLQPDDIGAYINLGRVLKAQEKYKESETAYLTAVSLMPKGKSFRIAPGHINVYYNLGNLVRLDPNRLNEAYNYYQTALSMKPGFVEAHMNKGDVLLRLNRTLEAKAAFEKALEYNPGYTDAVYNLANTYMQLGDEGNAEKNFRRALSQDGNHKLTLLNLAVLLEGNKGVASLKEAEELLKHYLRLEPNSSVGYFHLAVVYLEQREYNQSERMFLRTLELEPTYRAALYNLGFLMYHQARYGEVVLHLTKLMDLYPSHLNGAQTLADAYVQLSDPTKAEIWYKHVLRLDPNAVAALHNLGVVKATTGHMAEAVQLFSRTVELEPSHQTAKKFLEHAKKQLGQKP